MALGPQGSHLLPLCWPSPPVQLFSLGQPFFGSWQWPSPGAQWGVWLFSHEVGTQALPRELAEKVAQGTDLGACLDLKKPGSWWAEVRRPGVTPSCFVSRMHLLK